MAEYRKREPVNAEAEAEDMKILIVNDDGIESKDLVKLTETASELGDIWVVAPDRQCSAMAHRLLLGRKKEIISRMDFPAPVCGAYSVSGTPADCVKIALNVILPFKPDIVFSGINYGWNAGFDIAYSGTVAAALEARMQGIPAVAFSRQAVECSEVADRYLLSTARAVLAKEISNTEIWNVNFPGCSLEEYQGIRWDTKVAGIQMYPDAYRLIREEKSTFVVEENHMIHKEEAPAGSDLHALFNNCISVGKIRSHVLW